MKPNFKLRSFLVGSAFLAMIGTAQAAARYWDAISPDAGGPNGGTGTWSQTGNTWRDANSGGSRVAYSSGTNPQQASFLGDAGTYTVTVSGTVYISGNATGNGTAGLHSANSLTNYSFDGTGTIKLGETGAFIAVNSNEQFGSDLTIDNSGLPLVLSGGGVFNSKITGAGTLTNGSLTVVLNNVGNDYSGGTNVTSAGTLGFVSGALGTTGSITVNHSNTTTGNLRWESGNTQDISSRIVMQNAGNATFNTGANNVTFATGIGSNTSSSLNKTSIGTLTLTGTNTYTGTTTITGGTLQIGNGGTTGSIASTSSVTNNAALIYNRSNDLTAAYAIGGSGTLTKQGAGKLELTGTKDYSGATLVTGGTLAVNTTLSNTASVTVADTATLQGSGSINSSVTIQGGGFLASGTSIESLAMGTLTLDASSTFAYEIDKSVSLTVGGDLTAVTGTLNITAGAFLTLAELDTLSSGSWVPGETLTLISYTGAWNGGLFTYLGDTLADGQTFTFSGASWQFDYNNTSEGMNFTADSPDLESYVTMTVIPEPRAALLGSLGLLALLRRRR